MLPPGFVLLLRAAAFFSVSVLFSPLSRSYVRTRDGTFGVFQHPTEATTAVGTPMSVVGSAGPSSPKPFENDCVDDEVGGGAVIIPAEFSRKLRSRCSFVLFLSLSYCRRSSALLRESIW